MTANLLSETWTNLDSSELSLLLNMRIGGPGQYDGRSNNSNKLYLPLAGQYRIVEEATDNLRPTSGILNPPSVTSFTASSRSSFV